MVCDAIRAPPFPLEQRFDTLSAVWADSPARAFAISGQVQSRFPKNPETSGLRNAGVIRRVGSGWTHNRPSSTAVRTIFSSVEMRAVGAVTRG